MNETSNPTVCIKRFRIWNNFDIMLNEKNNQIWHSFQRQRDQIGYSYCVSKLIFFSQFQAHKNICPLGLQSIQAWRKQWTQVMLLFHFIFPLSSQYVQRTVFQNCWHSLKQSLANIRTQWAAPCEVRPIIIRSHLVTQLSWTSQSGSTCSTFVHNCNGLFCWPVC